MSIPGSPRSVSSEGSGSPPALDPSTLALLDSHFAARAEEENLFNQLAANRVSNYVAGLSDNDSDGSATGSQKLSLSVTEFQQAFGEDWQLSQFWYNPSFAERLADLIHTLAPDTAVKVAFLCCPTAFVAFQHAKHHPGAALLEYDQRFAVLSPKQFVHYDLNEPDTFPEALQGQVDLAIADPPFLNEATNRKLSQTLRQILHPTRGRLLLLTSTQVQDVLNEVYNQAPLGPLYKTKIVVEHSQLQNDFACWGSWPEAANLGVEKQR
ncbi:putative N6-adenine methyltransferase-domain-containing protein [Crepidotus variabilis]|uniref:N6-adenine methyltransferase-domain-containing protein n=1 Tax=Crepidotus variabilis TaxID=179855 RepID=A0A9P6JNX7_9AGAR|nr:putative N6-adenine methyltransferase-domain-containing protein [Crepidotus variabilis]